MNWVGVVLTCTVCVHGVSAGGRDGWESFKLHCVFMVFGRLSFNMHCMCLRCLGGMGGSHLTCTVGSWCLDGWAGWLSVI